MGFKRPERRLADVPLQPISQIDDSMRVGELACSLQKQPRAVVDIRLKGQDRRHAVHIVDHPSTLTVQFLIGIAEVVRTLRERLVSIRGIDIILGQRPRRRINLANGLGGRRTQSHLGRCGRVGRISDGVRAGQHPRHFTMD
jgi:hypothetical protein